jgi:epoxyqueuosine reductase
MQLAAYIRNLGYQAIASMNDTALVVPYAIKAGLGEYGRNQMVLTPQFGPRVRFSKIFTDMPLYVDVVREIGLTKYCHNCTICAEACPPKALPKGEPKVGSDSPSTLKGVKKWSANCEACFGYWAKLKTDCAICMRVCPFNHRNQGTVWYRLATSKFRKLAQWWAVRHKPARVKPSTWWAR